MSSEDVRDVVAAIHDSPVALVFEFAGAGSLALHWLHAVAGSSRTVLEATDRYSQASLSALLGEVPTPVVSTAVAAAMAEAAWARARELRPDGPVIGLSSTATIATDRAKRGHHRAVVAWHGGDRSAAHDLVLEKGRRDRAHEEDVVSRLVINVAAEGCGVSQRVDLDLSGGEAVEVTRVPA